MSCYDTVHVACPRCGKDITFQSKAGPCRLADYNYSSVPIIIAASLDGDSQPCPNCNTLVILTVPKTVERMAMSVRTSDEREWD